MKNPRKYGKAPYRIAVVHGGPGAAGGMAPVARELSRMTGVLEPLQRAGSVGGQVQELHGLLSRYCVVPVTLIGHSWGAFLSFLAGARYPSLVNRIILIGCGPFEERYASSIMKTRLYRLGTDARDEAVDLFRTMEGAPDGSGDEILEEIGNMMFAADSYDPIPLDTGDVEYRADIYRSVWSEASEMRRFGGLLAEGKRIECPVVVIHGDYDPHPMEGVVEPLSRIMGDLRIVSIPYCGHYPWYERRASSRFFEILREELQR